MPIIHEVATMTAKGQITVPKPICQALGADTGTKVTFELHENGTVTAPGLLRRTKSPSNATNPKRYRESEPQPIRGAIEPKEQSRQHDRRRWTSMWKTRLRRCIQLEGGGGAWGSRGRGAG